MGFKNRLYVIMAILSLVAVSGCQSTEEAHKACANDMRVSIKTSGGCFAIDALRAAPSLSGQPVVVFIHGDGGPGDYRKDYWNQIDALDDAKLNPIVLVRPGYRLPNGDETTGYARNSFDNYTPEIVAGIAEALMAFRAHHKPSRLILMGHSGGAMIAGIIGGRHPGAADAAVLVGWGCDTTEWRQWRIASAGRRGQWVYSLSARDFIDAVPLTMKLRAITGAQDSNTKSEFGRDCVQRLQARGVNATFQEVPGAGHSSAMSANIVTMAARELAQ